MSWHGPSAPRVEGIATKSRVVASWASKPASTASRIRCCVSAFMRRLQSRTQTKYGARSLASAAGIRKMRVPQGIFEQPAFRVAAQRCRTLDAVKQPRARFGRAENCAHRNALGIDRQRIVLLVVADALGANLGGRLLDLHRDDGRRLDLL